MAENVLRQNETTRNGLRVTGGGVLYLLLTLLFRWFHVPTFGGHPVAQFVFNLTVGVFGIAVGLIMIGVGVRTRGRSELRG